MNAKPEIWVYAEQENGQIAGVVFELLTEGRKLAAKSGFTLCAVLASADGTPMHQELFNYGAKKIYNVEDPKLNIYQNDYVSQVVYTLIERQFKHRFKRQLARRSAYSRTLATFTSPRPGKPAGWLGD